VGALHYPHVSMQSFIDEHVGFMSTRPRQFFSSKCQRYIAAPSASE